jgi:hypothetical protein
MQKPQEILQTGGLLRPGKQLPVQRGGPRMDENGVAPEWRMPADMNGDGAVNGADIDPFFECLGAGGCP